VYESQLNPGGYQEAIRMSRKIVVIGSSIAGISAAEAARKQDPEAEIVVLSHEAFMPYYRLRICEILNEPALAEKLFLHPATGTKSAAWRSV